MVCTPSHTAADVITQRLGKHLDPTQLFRLYQASRPVETVPSAVLKFCCQSTASGAFELPTPHELLNMQVIVCTCADAHVLYRVGLTNQQLRVRRKCFEGYLRQACSDKHLEVDLKGTNEPHFTHLFVDEAAQATEPETLIPLTVVVDPEAGYDKAEIILVGDPRQLSPAVYSLEAAKAGLERSLMERLLQRPMPCLGGGQNHMLGPDLVQMDEWLAYSFQKDGQEQLSVFLTLNYRCHPSFLTMPSALFYFDKLHCAGAEEKAKNEESYWCKKLRWVESLSKPVKAVISKEQNNNVPAELQCRKQFTWPIHCLGVEGTDKSVTIKSGFPSCTWSNAEEAQSVVNIVFTLAQNGVTTQSIGVMAPFRGQVVAIRKLLRARGLPGVNVGTIEDFQSVECDVCVISLTRSTPSFVQDDVSRRVGVFGQPKRSNVALTRAENLLIVVGSPTVMSNDPVWRQFLLFCLRNGLFYGNPGKDPSLLQWDPSTKLCRRVEPSAHEHENGSENVHRVVVGSLERVLRATL